VEDEDDEDDEATDDDGAAIECNGSNITGVPCAPLLKLLLRRAESGLPIATGAAGEDEF
jgi:hypothetical protein